MGASIQKYLLEKTRIVSQMEGERNFHIFYQLIRGAPEFFRHSLSLSAEPATYAYLSNVNSTLPNIDDADEFALTTTCMTSIGIDQAAQEHVFSLLSGVLLLGNVTFGPDNSEGQVGGITDTSRQFFDDAARCLGVDGEELQVALMKQNMHVGGQVIVKTQSQSQVLHSSSPWLTYP